jgi:hypothetical protein
MTYSWVVERTVVGDLEDAVLAAVRQRSMCGTRMVPPNAALGEISTAGASRRCC